LTPREVRRAVILGRGSRFLGNRACQTSCQASIWSVHCAQVFRRDQLDLRHRRQSDTTTTIVVACNLCLCSRRSCSRCYIVSAVNTHERIIQSRCNFFAATYMIYSFGMHKLLQEYKNVNVIEYENKYTDLAYLCYSYQCKRFCPLSGNINSFVLA